MKLIALLFSTLAPLGILFSQSNIQQSLSVNGTGAAAHASAQLDVSSTDKGVLVPRMTSAQRMAIASPAAGLLVFDTNTNGFWFYNGTNWQTIGSGMTGSPSLIQDADGDTRVLTEKNPNENIIRFDLGGTESMVLRKNASDAIRLEIPGSFLNTFVGQNAGESTMQTPNFGRGNTFTGHAAGRSNTSGRYNTANGLYALESSTTAHENTAYGAFSLNSTTTGHSNTASGSASLYANTTGYSNTANGLEALAFNTTGHSNTASGVAAMYNNSTGNENTASGIETLSHNTTGNSNTAYGVRALYSNTIHSGLVAVGDSALFNNGVGASGALSAINNTATGSKALFANTTGWDNTGIGSKALYSNTSGRNNTAVGSSALYSNIGGSQNTAIGKTALFSNTTGFGNTATGHGALYSNTTGFNITAIGEALFFNTTGYQNTATGSEALYVNTTGFNNTAIGYWALTSNTTGNYNTATGSESLFLNTVGNSNSVLGYEALNYNISGSTNTAIGSSALRVNSTGNNNTAVGAFAGDLYTSNNSTFLGRDAFPLTDGYTNCMGLGLSARPTGSNRIHIGNASIVTIAGQVAFTTYSDQQFKRNVAENVNGLDFILRLRPVTYNLDVHGLAGFLKEDLSRDEAGNITTLPPDEDTRRGRDIKSQVRYSGFIAQEVEAAATAVGYDFSGVDRPQNDAGLYGLRYAEFVVPLVKAVQEQQRVIENGELKMEMLERENAALKSQLEKITTALQGAGIMVEK